MPGGWIDQLFTKISMVLRHGFPDTSRSGESTYRRRAERSCGSLWCGLDRASDLDLTPQSTQPEHMDPPMMDPPPKHIMWAILAGPWMGTGTCRMLLDPTFD